jgi:hypothetical protein
MWDGFRDEVPIQSAAFDGVGEMGGLDVFLTSRSVIVLPTFHLRKKARGPKPNLSMAISSNF